MCCLDCSSPAGNAFDRARGAYVALEVRFATACGGLYREHATPVQGDRSFAYLWAFSQAQTAALDIAALPGGDPTLAHQRKSPSAIPMTQPARPTRH